MTTYTVTGDENGILYSDVPSYHTARKVALALRAFERTTEAASGPAQHFSVTRGDERVFHTKDGETFA